LTGHNFNYSSSFFRMTAVNPPANQASSVKPLNDQVGRVFIIAYKENTEVLEGAIAYEGLSCEVVRQQPNEAYRGYSPSYLTLMNHRNAWAKASQESKASLIVEADFVPVVGMGKLPMPYDATRPDAGLAWLYTCAPQVYTVTPEGYAQGFSTSMVAYIVTPTSAQRLVEFAEEILAKADPTAYTTWDSEIEKFLRLKGLKSYIAFRNFGEHGGRPNPEHRQHGLSTAHRADVLYGELAFMPAYAAGDRATVRFWWARSQARAKGIVRLLAGKFVRPKVIRESTVKGRILSFVIRRHLSWPI